MRPSLPPAPRQRAPLDPRAAQGRRQLVQPACAAARSEAPTHPGACSAPAHAAHHGEQGDHQAGPVHEPQQREAAPAGAVLADVHGNRVGHGGGPEAAGGGLREGVCRREGGQGSRGTGRWVGCSARTARRAPPPSPPLQVTRRHARAHAAGRAPARGPGLAQAHPSAPTRPTMAEKKGSATARPARQTT